MFGITIKTSFKVNFLLVIFLSVLTLGQSSCPNGWIHNGTVCYLYVETEVPMDTAEGICQDYNSDMIQSTDQQQLEFIQNIITSPVWVDLEDSHNNPHNDNDTNSNEDTWNSSGSTVTSNPFNITIGTSAVEEEVSTVAYGNSTINGSSSETDSSGSGFFNQTECLTIDSFGDQEFQSCSDNFTFVCVLPMELAQTTQTQTEEPQTITDGLTQYSTEPQTITNDPTQYSGEPHTITDDPTQYSGEPHTITNDPTQYSGEPHTITDDPTQYSTEPQIITDDPTQYSTEPQTITDGPTQYVTEPQIFTGEPTQLIMIDSGTASEGLVKVKFGQSSWGTICYSELSYMGWATTLCRIEKLGKYASAVLPLEDTYIDPYSTDLGVVSYSNPNCDQENPNVIPVFAYCDYENSTACSHQRDLFIGCADNECFRRNLVMNYPPNEDGLGLSSYAWEGLNFKCNGVVSGWTFFALAPGKVKVMVFRVKSSQIFLIKIWILSVSEKGYQTNYASMHDENNQFFVRKDDFIAIDYYDDGNQTEQIIPYGTQDLDLEKYGLNADNLRRCVNTTFPDENIVGRQYVLDFGNSNCASAPAILPVFKWGLAEGYCSKHSLGNFLILETFYAEGYSNMTDQKYDSGEFCLDLCEVDLECKAMQYDSSTQLCYYFSHQSQILDIQRKDNITHYRKKDCFNDGCEESYLQLREVFNYDTVLQPGVFSVDICQELCNMVESCNGFVFNTSHETHKCYHWSNNILEFESDSSMDFYLKQNCLNPQRSLSMDYYAVGDTESMGASFIGFPSLNKDGAVLGKALTLNRNGDESQYLDLGQKNWECLGNFNLCPQGYTFSFWIQFLRYSDEAAGDDPQPILCNGNGQGSANNLNVEEESGLLFVDIEMSGKYFHTETAVEDMPQLEEWVLLTFTGNGSYLALYINGKMVSDNDVPHERVDTPGSYRTMRFGKSCHGEATYASIMLDELKFFDSYLPRDDFERLYSYSSIAPKSSLNMNQLYEKILLGDLNGTTVNSPILVPSFTSSLENALSLNGINQWVNYAYQRDTCFWNLDQCSIGVTYAVWLSVGWKEADVLYFFSNGGHSEASHGVALYLLQGSLACTFRSENQEWTVRISDHVERGVYLHVAVTWKSAYGATLYLNGEVVAQTVIPNPYNQTSERINNFTIGGNNEEKGEDLGDFYMDDFLFWETFKEESFIKELYEDYDPPEISLFGLPRNGFSQHVFHGTMLLLDMVTNSFDVNMVSKQYKYGMEFSWTCISPIPLESNGNTTDCSFAFVDTEANGTLLIDTDVLTPLNKYLIVATIQQNSRIVSKGIEIYISEAGDPLLQIRCLENCLDYPNPQQMMILEANITNGESLAVTYEWKLILHTLEGATVVHNSSGDSRLVIEPFDLEYGQVYEITLKGSYSDRRILHTLEAKRFIVTNSPPSDGNCVVLPRKGFGYLTEFWTYCSGWIDEGDESLPLEYSYFAIDEENATVLYHNGSETQRTFIIETLGDPENNFYYYIFAEIYDKYGTYAEVTIEITVEEEYSPVIVVLKRGDNQKVLQGQTLLLDAMTNTHNIEEASPQNKNNMIFSWSCKSPQGIGGCDIALNASQSIGFAYFDSTTLAAGVSYEIFVKVEFGATTRRKFFEIEVLEAVEPLLEIRCESNCIDYPLPRKDMIFETNCVNCAGFDDWVYEWELKEGDVAVTHELETGNSTAFIPGETLSYGKLYSLQFTTRYDFNSESPAEGNVTTSSPIVTSKYITAVIHFTTNSPPSGGRCNISPGTGYASVTEYILHCGGWSDEGIPEFPITYRYFALDSDGDIILYHYGPNPRVNFTIDTLGDPNDNFKYFVYVELYDKYGSYTEITLDVIVEEEYSPVKATLKKGLYQKVLQGETLLLDGITNTFDSEIESLQNKDGMEFFWSCTGTVECQSALTTVSSDGFINFVTTSLPAGATYEILLRVEKNDKSTRVVFNIEVLRGSEPIFGIRCMSNCTEYLSTMVDTLFEMECKNCDGIYDWIYQWVLTDGDTVIKNQTGDNLFGLPSYVFLLPAFSLEQNTLYKLQLGASSLESGQYHRAVNYFVTNAQPSGGECSISPDSGIAMVTEFTITCSGWDDEGLSNATLRYEYLSLLTGDILNDSPEPVVSGLLLALGDSNDGFLHSIQTRIYDSYGDFAEVIINVVVELTPSSVKVILTRGHRQTVNVGSTLLLDAFTNTYDDKAVSRQDREGMTFSWACESPPALPDCNDAITPVTSAATSGGRVLFDAEELSSNVTYQLTVTVAKNASEASLDFSVTVLTPSEPVLTIECVVNCVDFTPISFKKIFMASCTNCISSSEILYDWTLTQKYVTKKRVTTDSSFGMNAYTLDPAQFYQVNVKTSFGEPLVTLESFFYFTTDTPPSGGSCSITPDIGFALTTYYTISCSGWQDEGLSNPSLNYRYFSVNNGISELYYFSSNPLVSGLLLSEGDPNDNYKKVINAEIFDQYYANANFSMFTTVYPPNVTDEMVPTVIEDKKDTIDMLIEANNTMAAVGVMQSVASLLNEDKISDSDDIFTTEAASQVRTAVIKRLDQIYPTANSGNDIRQISQAMSSLTAVKQEVTDSTIELASDMIFGIAQRAEQILANEPNSIGDTVRDVLNAAGGILLLTVPDAVIPDQTPEILPDVVTVSPILDSAGLDPEEAAFYEKQNLLQLTDQNNVEKIVAKKTVPNIDKTAQLMSEIVQSNLIKGEPAVTFDTPGFLLYIEKQDDSALSNASISLENTKVTLPKLNGTEIKLKLMEYGTSPYVWGENSDSITSPCSKIILNASMESIKISVSIKSGSLAETSNHTQTFNNGTWAYHKLNITATSQFIIQLQLDDTVIKFDIYVKKGQRPTTQDYDYFTTLHRNESNAGIGTVLVPKTNMNGTGIYYLGLDPQKNENAILSRKRRDVDNSTESDNTTESSSDTGSVAYGISMATTQCKIWDVYSQDWVDDGCEVGAGSTVEETVCECEPTQDVTTISLSFITPPNTIDFSTVFSKFDLVNNAAVFSTVIAVLLLYILLMIWARRCDKKEIRKHTLECLVDNDPKDSYIYIIRVDTGFSPGSGTNAPIKFHLFGNKMSTGDRQLCSEAVDRFPRGSQLSFVLQTQKSLGQLSELAIWVDDKRNKTKFSWFLSRVIVEDVKNEKKCTFICNQWFSLSKGDCQIQRNLYPAKREVLTKFSYLYKESSKEKVTDHHMWVSVFLHPFKSDFTRTQRLSTCISFLFLTMIASAMFYRTEEQDERPVSFTLGPLTFSLHELYVSVVSLLIVIPVNLLIIELFRRTNKKKEDQTEQLRQIIENIKKTQEELRKEAEAPIVKHIPVLPVQHLYLRSPIDLNMTSDDNSLMEVEDEIMREYGKEGECEENKEKTDKVEFTNETGGREPTKWDLLANGFSSTGYKRQSTGSKFGVDHGKVDKAPLRRRSTIFSTAVQGFMKQLRGNSISHDTEKITRTAIPNKIKLMELIKKANSMKKVENMYNDDPPSDDDFDGVNERQRANTIHETKIQGEESKEGSLRGRAHSLDEKKWKSSEGKLLVNVLNKNMKRSSPGNDTATGNFCITPLSASDSNMYLDDQRQLLSGGSQNSQSLSSSRESQDNLSLPSSSRQYHSYRSLPSSREFQSTQTKSNNPRTEGKKDSYNTNAVHRKSDSSSATPCTETESGYSSRELSICEKGGESRADGSHGENDDTKENTKPKTKTRKQWPFWLNYVAWTLVFFAIVTPAFFVILYSMEWGPAKSNAWLTAFVMSFVESTFLFDPLKVLVLTFVAVLIMQRALGKSMDKMDEGDSAAARGNIKLDAKAAKKKAAKVKAARHLIRDIILLIVMTALAYCIGYINRDSSSYQVNRTIRTLFIDGTTGFSNKVTSKATFFDWLQTHFIPGYFVSTDMNGKALNWRERRFLADRTSYRVGPARLRQLRIKPGHCIASDVYTCYREYDTGNEDGTTFGPGLINVTTQFDPLLSREAFSRVKASAIDGVSHWGLMSMYDGGGYIAELGLNADITESIVQQLRDHLWLDHRSRVVFLEFTVYNPALNLFSVVTLVTELPASGGALTSFTIDIMKIYSVGWAGIFTRVCEALYLLFLVVTLVLLIIKLKQEWKDKVCRNITVWLDIIIQVTSYAAVVVNIMRYIELQKTMTKFKEDNRRFVQMRHIATLDHTYNYTLAFLTFALALKLIALLRLNKRFAMLAATLKLTVKPLFYFSVQVCFVFFAFNTFYFLFYGTQIYGFSTFIRSGETLLNFSLGSFIGLDEMMNYAPHMSPLIFCLYATFNSIMAMNVLVTIMMFSYEDVKTKDNRGKGDYKLVPVMMTEIKSLFQNTIKAANRQQ